MKKFLFIIFISATLSAQSQICDSLVPTYYIDFTGANAGTSWNSGYVNRNGHCCSAIGLDRCIDFVFTVDSNTSGVRFDFFVNPPIGAVYYQVDCNPQTYAGDTTPVTTCGVHCLTMCKPGNGYVMFIITSILATNPTACTGYTQCDTMLPTHVNELRIEHSSEIFPNPFQTTGVLKISGTQYTYGDLYIYDRMGQLVRRETLNGQTTLINRGSLSAGIYFYQLLFEDKHATTGKFVIE